ncbi:craniofacial development protein 1 [Condylostylus longicornis]|uniref:craniofacial development protein 1 n=1 Tax=Condylostylus longicornis TaxID=2530218 RepID=UPI00244DD039|nr:craniofacial development protein 1 [Condylostylus longicornis]
MNKMNKDQDYPSDSDESDKDFCPDNESDSDIPSEEEPDYKNSESEEEEKRKKVKISGKKKGVNSGTKTAVNNSCNTIESPSKSNISEEEEKKRSDDLWASFLNDVNETESESRDEKRKSLEKEVSIIAKQKPQTEKIEPKKSDVTEIVEFAGEVAQLKNKRIELPKNETELTTNKQINKFCKVPFKRAGGGLGAVLNQIGKKSKISVLEKSKIDWEGFKEKEDLKEELQTFNKGKDGYLERQDFLQRTDLRQFEIEKSMRQARRKF